MNNTDATLEQAIDQIAGPESMIDYQSFLEETKRLKDAPTGIEVDALNPKLFPFQDDIARWALRRGRSAIFAGCGLGKSAMQAQWVSKIPGRKIITTPLAVAEQMVDEAAKFGVDAKYLRDDDGKTEVVVTNYEMLDRFRPCDFQGIALDESSILKSHTSKFRTKLIEQWGQVPFRLCATATPAPNDFMELGNHAEFLGVMTRAEMLSQFFVHDGGETQKWRIKGHAEESFWEWVASWAVMVQKPSDLGYKDGAFILPPLHTHQHTVTCSQSCEGMLFAMEARTLQERQAARRSSIKERCALVAEIASSTTEPFAIWCDLNAESTELKRLLPDFVEIRGADTPDHKVDSIQAFRDGTTRGMITKPSICGHGSNWQHCHLTAFTGLSDSFELYYQAIRRFWRFGQQHPVTVSIVTGAAEGAVLANIQRKERDAQSMADRMTAKMRDLNQIGNKDHAPMSKSYHPTKPFSLPNFLA
jgi:hypothetical protein